MTPSTRLEAALYLPAAVTLTLTVDPTGTPRVSTYTLAADTILPSITAFLAAWNTEIVADLIGAGMGSGAAASCAWQLDQADDGEAWATFSTGGALHWSCDWDGSAIGEWLGYLADVTDDASGTLGDQPAAAVWPTYGAQQYELSQRSRARMWRQSLGGAIQTARDTASDAGTMDADQLTVRLVLLATENQLGSGDPNTCQTRTDALIDWMVAASATGSGMRLSIVHGNLARSGPPSATDGAAAVLVRPAGDLARWSWERGPLAGLWRLALDLETCEATP